MGTAKGVVRAILPFSSLKNYNKDAIELKEGLRNNTSEMDKLMEQVYAGTKTLMSLSTQAGLIFEIGYDAIVNYPHITAGYLAIPQVLNGFYELGKRNQRKSLEAKVK